ncbi:MAG: hypothetical protein L0Z53_21660 [Acidobacteriales bacterium]|nr:hypothetical protein [Terriglobales bacterium]
MKSLSLAPIQETATYKPAISDLEKLARYFGVPITAFFPDANPKSRANALLSATADLNDADLDEGECPVDRRN